MLSWIVYIFFFHLCINLPYFFGKIGRNDYYRNIGGAVMKYWGKLFLICILFLLLPYVAYAHPGRTDENGGHYDHSTGEYHYHHGYPAHQHENGICPYESVTAREDNNSYPEGGFSRRIAEREKEATYPTKKYYFNVSGEPDTQETLSSYTDTDYLAMQKQRDTFQKKAENLENKLSAMHLNFQYLLVFTFSLSVFLIIYIVYLIITRKQYRKQAEQLTHQLVAVSQENEDLKNTDIYQKYSNIEKERNFFEQKTAEHTETINTLQKELKESRLYNQDLNNKNQHLTRKISELEVQLNDFVNCDLIIKNRHQETEIFSLTEKLNASQYQINLLEGENARLQRYANTSNIRISELEEYCDIIKEEIQKLSVNAVTIPEQFLQKAEVPYGVIFDRDLLPHYFVNATVEKHMHVYISPSGNCYHRKLGCSGAAIPVHLFTVADTYTPCERCIPYEARNYKLPKWYYEILKLVEEEPALFFQDDNSAEA